LFYQVTRFTFGTRVEPARFEKTQWLFLRCLAVVYAIAFASLSVQVIGLIGARGISPARDFLTRVASSFGPMRFVALPTVFWWSSSDAVLRGATLAGVALALLLFLGYAQRIALALLFILYLSFSAAGQEFLTFQWDSLLIETGFLAIFFGRSESGTRTIAWLYRWLVFRLYFLSGYVKLGSHDPTWAGGTAMKYQYHTQPLPNVIAWYADKLPDAIQRASTYGTLAIEFGVPFLIFAPRRWRQAGAWIMLLLQALIFLTGNYTFFNLLTASLILFLFDDQAFESILRRVTSVPRPSTKRARMGLALLTALILSLGLTRIFETIYGAAPDPFSTLVRATAPFEIVNSYGLFAVMTVTRPEIIVEGSDDGDHWSAYEFRYKPGDLHRAPPWVEPHQPRLDWQMWFAALGSYQSNPWFLGFCLRLLDGSPEVTALLKTNPFPDHPPRYVRAMSYDYTFTSLETHRRTGAWWERGSVSVYLPPIGLKPPDGSGGAAPGK
jgi:hypothetical protein